MSKDAPVNLALIRTTARYYARQKRWWALVKAMWLTVALRYGVEICQECAGRYPIWWAPQPLWDELMPQYHGTLCVECFNAKAVKARIRLMWTPMVTERDGVATTNWWFDPTRDALMMGEPDLSHFEGGRACVPQGPWARIAPLFGNPAPYYTPEPK